jgi:hypothetical protein
LLIGIRLRQRILLSVSAELVRQSTHSRKLGKNEA